MIYRLTRCALNSTPGLVDIRAWPYGANGPIGEQWRQWWVAQLISEGALVPHDPDADEAAWREHFGILAEIA